MLYLESSLLLSGIFEPWTTISTFPGLQQPKFSLLSCELPFLIPRLRVGHTVPSPLCLLSMLSTALPSPVPVPFTSGHQPSATGDPGRGECPSMEVEFLRVFGAKRNRVSFLPHGKGHCSHRPPPGLVVIQSTPVYTEQPSATSSL